MRSEINQTGISTLLYIFNKNMRNAIQGLHVDMNSLKEVKSYIQAGYKVLFLPQYKSFMDFFILTYINYTQSIESGFTFGNFEDTPKIMFLDRILRTSGYIFSRRKPG